MRGSAGHPWACVATWWPPGHSGTVVVGRPQTEEQGYGGGVFPAELPRPQSQAGRGIRSPQDPNSDWIPVWILIGPHHISDQTEPKLGRGLTGVQEQGRWTHTRGLLFLAVTGGPAHMEATRGGGWGRPCRSGVRAGSAGRTCCVPQASSSAAGPPPESPGPGEEPWGAFWPWGRAVQRPWGENRLGSPSSRGTVLKEQIRLGEGRSAAGQGWSGAE